MSQGLPLGISPFITQVMGMQTPASVSNAVQLTGSGNTVPDGGSSIPSFTPDFAGMAASSAAGNDIYSNLLTGFASQQQVLNALGRPVDPSEMNGKALSPGAVATLTALTNLGQANASQMGGQSFNLTPGTDPNTATGSGDAAATGFNTGLDTGPSTNMMLPASQSGQIQGSPGTSAIQTVLAAVATILIQGLNQIQGLISQLNPSATAATGVSNPIPGTVSAVDPTTLPSQDGQHLFAETPLMQAVADQASQTAQTENTTGFCARGVYDTLTALGLYNGPLYDAYQFAPALQADSHLAEYTGAKSYQDLLNLPAGCIIQWASNANDPFGHITVTDGQGGENSDHYSATLYNIGTPFHVFVPVG